MRGRGDVRAGVAGDRRTDVERRGRGPRAGAGHRLRDALLGHRYARILDAGVAIDEAVDRLAAAAGGDLSTAASTMAVAPRSSGWRWGRCSASTPPPSIASTTSPPSIP
ncbi:hypothetical protein AB5I41_03040 [Sphingomonas sp. MMS24-JH45]